MKILDFYADWCGPCKMMSPIIEEIEKEYSIKVEKINVDENQELAQSMGILSIPTIIVKDGDEEISRFIGFTPKTKIVETLTTARLVQR